jgi:hypothetical protein
MELTGVLGLLEDGEDSGDSEDSGGG